MVKADFRMTICIHTVPVPSNRVSSSPGLHQSKLFLKNKLQSCLHLTENDKKSRN
jgi:hypothetical protein